jgi:hypothetical protein
VDDHEVDVRRDRLRGESGDVGGTGGDAGSDGDAQRAKDLDHPGDGMESITRLAGARIVDEDRGARQEPR